SESTADAPCGNLPLAQKSPSARSPGSATHVRSEVYEVPRSSPDGRRAPSSRAETMVKRTLCAAAGRAASSRRSGRSRLMMSIAASYYGPVLNRGALGYAAVGGVMAEPKPPVSSDLLAQILANATADDAPETVRAGVETRVCRTC